MARAEYKVPGGKLLAAESEAKGGKLLSVKLTGDFFMHPEYAIEELEEELKGIPLAKMGETIQGFFDSSDVQLIGASPSDITHVVKLSLGS
jgi:lipoate-protein ligase A